MAPTWAVPGLFFFFFTSFCQNHFYHFTSIHKRLAGRLTGVSLRAARVSLHVRGFVPALDENFFSLQSYTKDQGIAKFFNTMRFFLKFFQTEEAERPSMLLISDVNCKCLGIYHFFGVQVLFKILYLLT